MRQVGEIRVFLDAEQIVEVAEELEARDDVDVPLAPVGNDLSHLILA